MTASSEITKANILLRIISLVVDELDVLVGILLTGLVVATLELISDVESLFIDVIRIISLVVDELDVLVDILLTDLVGATLELISDVFTDVTELLAGGVLIPWVEDVGVTSAK